MNTHTKETMHVLAGELILRTKPGEVLEERAFRAGDSVHIPAGLIPEDAHVEMEAKKAAGYYTGGETKDARDLHAVRGRDLSS